MTRWVESYSVAWAGHGMTPGGRHGNGKRDSTRSRLSIETNDLSNRSHFGLRLASSANRLLGCIVCRVSCDRRH